MKQMQTLQQELVMKINYQYQNSIFKLLKLNKLMDLFKKKEFLALISFTFIIWSLVILKNLVRITFCYK
ncbi:unnamed protein product [Paramecium sonneborni]|uniref:Transmembrane protein n=1 Tax=Paramecium sonneborni TaxID=65129 RepID=A0A8S1PTY4_9CILI|nr:unnamed protein product [Paramecium sonneborni]